MSASDDTIVFLCPNGHKLNGPTELQGTPGQCPHCGEKFRIPVYDRDKIKGDDVELATDQSDSLTNQIGMAPSTGEEHNLDVVLGSLESARNKTYTDEMARRFSWMWKQRGPDSIVEIMLGHGEKIVPDYFSDELSGGSSGLFAISDGAKFTMIAVPWAEVKRVTIRRLPNLPPGFKS